MWIKVSDDKRVKGVLVRLTVAEHEEFSRLAAERHTTMSEMIRDAVAITRWKWPLIPELGMITFVDESKVRRKRDAGRCFRRAGFVECGRTKGGLLALQLSPNEMPQAMTPQGWLL